VIKPVFNFPVSAVWPALDVQGPKSDYGPQLSDIVTPVVIVADTTVNAAGSARGEAFMAGAYQGAIAGQRSHIQLHNPATSTKRLYVDDLLIWSETAGLNRQAICWHNVALGAAFVFNQHNKNWHVFGASTAPVAQIIGFLDGVGAAHGSTQTYVYLNGAANGERVPLYEPFVIHPGYSMVIRPDTANNVGIGARWQWREQ
jgi:hypothetical protein